MKRVSAAALTLLITGLLVANSADFFFRQPYHEVWDSAANSLSVLRAKHFAQVYGPYSRWGFYHPGPTLFYVQAFGEFLFYDTLGWTRSPFAGQTLAHTLVMSGFFVAALTTFANWLPSGRPRWWFLCGALVLAVLHFTAMERVPSYDVLHGPSAFLSPWSAHALVLPFLCLLAAGSSVAAGRGEDLPILALASGYLLQLHVAEPMFVFPVFALAYVALGWQESPSGYAWRLPWREHRRAHVLTGLILLFFALPFLLDFSRGRDSNAAVVWQHLREYHTHKPLERAVFYFLMFGAYTAYNPVDNEFAAYDHPGMWAFLREHAGLYVLWSMVAVVILWTSFTGWRRGQITGGLSMEEPGRRFRGWSAVFLGLIVVLTLRWNTRQDEQMFYFNSWFTFAIYYFAALLALAVGCAALRRNAVLRLEIGLGVGAMAAVAIWNATALRLTDPSPATTRALHADILRLEAASWAAWSGVKNPVRMLHFEYDTSPVAVGVALQLARDGVPFCTENRWHAYLGDAFDWSHSPVAKPPGTPVQVWRFAHADSSGSGVHLAASPYLLSFFQAADDLVVRYTDLPVDPAAPGGGTIRFGPAGDAPRFGVGGWFTADDGQTWIDDPHALLAFRPVPLLPANGELEITLVDLASMLTPAQQIVRQRLRVFFDGQPLGAKAVLTSQPTTLTFRLPVARWNAASQSGASGGRLLLELPDALPAPKPNAFAAQPPHPAIGLGLREIRFRQVEATAR